MKNKNLKALMTTRAYENETLDEFTILNKEQLLYATGGSQKVECPVLTSCTTLSDCNGKCAIDGIKIPIL